MFCPQCGSQNAENSAFCSSCGKALTIQNKQNVSSALPWSKSKNNKLVAVIIGLAAFLVASCIIAPAVSNSYKDNVGKEISDQQGQVYGKEEDNQHSDVSGIGTVRTKMFENKADGAVDMMVNLIYYDDGTVTSVIGYINIYDLTVDGAQDIQRNVTLAQDIIDTSDIENVQVTVDDSGSSYLVTYSFTNLHETGREEACELAASFIGVSAENGRMDISSIEEELTGYGFSLKKEF